MAYTLQTYITQVQRLLHDPNGDFWPVTELTDYINEARERIAGDTKCLRQLVTSIPLTQGIELYSIASAAASATPAVTNNIIDVMGITLYWGNTRYKLNYMSFSQLDAYARAWQQYQTRPVIFSRMGALNVYVAPIPDQAYVTDWDCVVMPTPLVATTDTDTIPDPFNFPVKYWAASLAKFKEQAYGEADMFRKQYMVEGLRAQRVFQTRVLPNPYQT